ncbi:hypothetical protein RS130_14035 [Paraglaciecola aquimarina]|uniref:Uncharacterized protein n=1 Tax=Paraglaciecola aquimarina TaxID=1235557 RepID=A0ABU3SY02_9ALTE|nr:hypothetical protein [Paraglaciecola aquimarina]MDU0354876.1 hypothetical protein [Paraglaciecola aquimarina]
MKTLFTKSTIAAITLVAALFSQSSNAKISKAAEAPVENSIAADLLTEFNNVIDGILGNVEQPKVQKTIAKQLTTDTVELKANELVQEVDKTFPKFKFKVVIKD